MKKIKKLITILSCFAMILVSSVAFTGCDIGEIKENTKVSTETAIETSSSIIPVELSKATAQSIFTGAIENMIITEKFGYSGFMKNYGESISNVNAVGVLDENGLRYVYAHGDDESNARAFGYYDGNYCTLNIKQKTYRTGINEQFLIIGANLDQVVGLMVPNITAGRYYDGHFYISAQIQDNDETIFIEALVKDDKFIKLHYLVNCNDKNIQSMQLNFTYENIDTSKVVMSLDGYTKEN